MYILFMNFICVKPSGGKVNWSTEKLLSASLVSAVGGTAREWVSKWSVLVTQAGRVPPPLECTIFLHAVTARCLCGAQHLAARCAHRASCTCLLSHVGYKGADAVCYA
jgi:hypothetical protein